MRLDLALAGDPLSGKSTAGEYLEQRGFSSFTGSEYLQQEANRYSISLKYRGDYVGFQRKLRAQRSLSFVSDAFFELPDPLKVQVGIRNRYDVDSLKSKGGIIVALYCPVEERFKRRNDNPKYPNTLQAFIDVERKEYNDPDSLGVHTHYAMDQADHWIDTRQPEIDVHRALDEIIDIHSVQ